MRRRRGSCEQIDSFVIDNKYGVPSSVTRERQFEPAGHSDPPLECHRVCPVFFNVLRFSNPRLRGAEGPKIGAYPVAQMDGLDEVGSSFSIA